MSTLVAVTVALVALLLAAYGFHRRRRRMPGPRMRRILSGSSRRWIRDLVIPDDVDGHIHVGHLLDTDAGFVVLDVTRVDGAIFGAERMDQWSVVQNGKSLHFRNPLQVNRNRVTAVRQLAGGVPVHGLVVLLGAVEFPKGTPPGVATLEDLPTALDALPRQQAADDRQRRDEAWYGLAACANGD